MATLVRALQRCGGFALTLCCSFLGTSSLAQESPAKALSQKTVPALARAPRLDGNLKDWKGLALPGASGGGTTLAAQVAWAQDVLYLGVTVTDPDVQQNDVLDVTLFFPGAGLTARGHAFRFSADGQRSPEPEWAAPVFAQHLVKGTAQRTATGWTLEVGWPPRALPRFPTREPLVAEMCLTYVNRANPGQKPTEVSTCPRGAGPGEALRLPNRFRDALRLKLPASVSALEPREQGWAGFGSLHFPVWVQADEPLSPGLLVALVAEEPVDPSSAHLAMPAELMLPGRHSIWPVVSGKDPYAVEGKCDAERELRLGLYLAVGKTANRVLEWPAATCALGRASSVGLDEDGALIIGYSNGATVNFAWSTDHFERTEFGKR